jgi:hypothetical protein
VGTTEFDFKVNVVPVGIEECDATDTPTCYFRQVGEFRDPPTGSNVARRGVNVEAYRATTGPFEGLRVQVTDPVHKGVQQVTTSPAGEKLIYNISMVNKTQNLRKQVMEKTLTAPTTSKTSVSLTPTIVGDGAVLPLFGSLVDPSKPPR